MHHRQNTLTEWLRQTLHSNSFLLTPLAGDASFRRYYRLHDHGISRIVMDAPPHQEALAPFVEIAEVLRAYGVLTPKIHALNPQEGFALLDDFGDDLLLSKLSFEQADDLYQSAIKTLLLIQQCPLNKGYAFARFDSEFMRNELKLFEEWFLTAYLNITLTQTEQASLDEFFAWLIAEIDQQPKVVIHRDYHSRNILMTGPQFSHQLAIIDFQDAMQGPITYDLVSLLKDCYIQWPRDKVLQWVACFYHLSPQAKALEFTSFVRAFDLCGLQRHLKVLGIFCRLHLRDGKANYLKHLPLVLDYVLSCLKTYDDLRPLYQLMLQKVHLP